MMHEQAAEGCEKGDDSLHHAERKAPVISTPARQRLARRGPRFGARGVEASAPCNGRIGPPTANSEQAHRQRGKRQAAPLSIWILLGILALSVACSNRKVAQVPVPPPPPPGAGQSGTAPGASENPSETLDYKIPKNAKPIFVETGIASWYGPPYDRRQGANGEIYDMHALTAAHRTLPLNSIVRVTNLETGHSTVVRITDRGPFIEERILDLSLAAAKKVDVWRPGLARVKLEVLYAPLPIESGGRWCVQIGALSDKKKALKFKEQLQHRYREATVLEFKGPTGEWIRIRVEDDDKKRAEKVVREVAAPEGAVFLVRLD